MRSSQFILMASLAALNAGCAVGPDFKQPPAPDAASYDDQALPKSADADGVTTQYFAPNQSLPAQWWELFQSGPLNGLIAQALLHNPDLEAAEASLRAADEDLAAGEGELFPTVNADFTTTRQKTTGASNGGNAPGSIFTLHNASVNVSYGIDLFGGTRRAVEQLEAQRDYQGYELEAARVSLTANVVTTAIQEASLNGQIAATQKLIEEQSKQVSIAKQQLDAGAITRLVLLAEKTNLAQTKATLPPLEKQLATTRHALATLVGEFPTQNPRASFKLEGLRLPQSLPLSLPSQLVEQRPDIRAAEANLHAASAAIGVAEAARLPQLTLSADIGSMANKLQNLFTPGGGIWAIGASLGETIFDAGSLAHKQGAAEARYDAAAAMYRKTVLSAFQDVADTLRALEFDAKAVQAQSEAEQAATESLKLAQNQFNAGAISYLSLLDAQSAEQKSRIALVQAEAQRFADTAALFQALGGGWTTPTTTNQNSVEITQK